MLIKQKWMNNKFVHVFNEIIKFFKQLKLTNEYSLFNQNYNYNFPSTNSFLITLKMFPS